MTQRLLYRDLPMTKADNAAIHRVARRIFSRHLHEGDPITWQQAKEDAERAWWDVQMPAKKREVAS